MYELLFGAKRRRSTRSNKRISRRRKASKSKNVKVGKSVIAGKKRQIYKNEKGEEFFLSGLRRTKKYLKNIKAPKRSSRRGRKSVRRSSRRGASKRRASRRTRRRSSRRGASKRRASRRVRKSVRRTRRRASRRGSSKRRSVRRRASRRQGLSFGSFGGGRADSLLGMQGPYM